MALANYVKFLRGTPEAYKKLGNRVDPDTLYFIYEVDSNQGVLYLGTKKIAGGGTDGVIENITIDNLSDVLISKNLATTSFLTYDTTQSKWVDTPIDELIFAGETPGLVPAATMLEPEKYFLRADGTWAEIETPEATSATQVFEITLTKGQTHADAISTKVGDAKLAVGDIAIVKELITTGVTDNEEKYHYTSYVYNGSAWAAMDGNYNAKNIYFNNDFTFTEAIGTVSIPSSGSTVVEAKGKNLVEFLAALFAEEDLEPDVTNPTVDSFNMTKTGSYEAGTTVTGITYSASFTDGNYQYGPEPTGSTVTGWTIKDNAGNSIGTTASGNVADITITDSTSFSLRATADYTNGVAAKTNLGNDSDVKITAGTTASVSSNSITGYRNTFYGTMTSKDDITATIIRGLSKSGRTYSNGSTFNINIPIGAIRTVIAIPANLREPTKVLDSNDSNANINGNFIKNKFTLSVPGANGLDAIDYNVYYDDYANANTVVNTYAVTI